MASCYIAKHVTQIDSGKCKHTNCWAAVGAYLVDSGTRGRKRPTPMEFRARAGALKDCRTGGLGDLIVGCRKYGVKCVLLSDVPRAKAVRLFAADKARRVYGVPFDWERWDDKAKCAGDYDGYHMAAVIPGMDKAKGIRIMDPLCKRIKRVRRRTIIQAAIEYNDEHAGEVKDTIDLVYVVVPHTCARS